MSKASIESVEAVLRANNIAPQTIVKVVNELEEAIADEKQDRPAKTKSKSQFVIIASDPNGVITTDLTGWVMQIEEGVAPSAALDRIKEAALGWNRTKKGTKHPVRSIAETLENVPARFFKSPGKKTLPKTKTPVEILKTNGSL